MRTKLSFVFLCLMGLLFAGMSLAEETKPNIKYKGGKEVNFEELLIQGQLQRPNITVVTGESEQGSDGLLRLRENFLDQIASDTGESVR